MYTLEFCEDRPPLGEFMPMLKRFHLVPDWWLENPDEAEALHSFRWLWRVLFEDRTVGWIWLDGFIPGRCGVMGIVVEPEHRRKWHADVLVELRRLIWGLMTEHNVPRLSVLTIKGHLWAEMFFRKRLGFQFEGYARQSLTRRGKHYDQVMLSLTLRDLKQIGSDRYGSDHSFVVDYRGGGTPRAAHAEEAKEVQLSRHGRGSEAGGGGSGEDLAGARRDAAAV